MDKKKSRREFLELGLKVGIALPITSSMLYSCISKAEGKNTSQKETSKKLKILILGGTSFLGPHQIAYALGRGHSVSTFTRGKTAPTIYKDLFKEVEQLVGDREDNLTALENRKWDVVIDNSGRRAEWTKKTATLLKDNCDLYLYTSSTGVFYPYVNSEFKETSKVFDAIPEDATEDQKRDFQYGVMKANSENEAIKQFGIDRTIVVRPTYMLGPADRTDRFMHWPLRLKKGGEILIPGKEEDTVQYIDVRDVAEWMIRLLEDRSAGTYNAVGPKATENILDFVTEAKKTFDAESSFVRIDNYDFLKDNNVFYMIPWILPTDNYAGSAKINNSMALANGLSFRPLKETIADVYNWWHSDAVSQERRDKFASNPNSMLLREAAIIKKWKAL